MVAQKFGKADPDLRNRQGHGKTKELLDKPMLKASMRLPTTGMVGGIANEKGNPSAKKSGPKGSVTRTG